MTTETEVRMAIAEYCLARKAYDLETFPGGFPTYATNYRLYHAGRRLFELAGIEPAPGRFESNSYFEEPLPDRLRGML